MKETGLCDTGEQCLRCDRNLGPEGIEDNLADPESQAP